MGCIDMNVWYSRVDKPDRPDFVLFDLDPSPDVGFRETVQVALLVKEVLDALDLQGFPKTSGSDGIHVLVPIERRYSFADTREFAEIVARTLESTHRGLVTTAVVEGEAPRRAHRLEPEWRREDHRLRLLRASSRGAPVSTPLRWDEVDESLDPRDFTMDVVLGRVEREGDLYEPVLTMRQSIGAARQEAALAPKSARQGSTPSISTAIGVCQSSRSILRSYFGTGSPRGAIVLVPTIW